MGWKVSRICLCMFMVNGWVRDTMEYETYLEIQNFDTEFVSS